MRTCKVATRFGRLWVLLGVVLCVVALAGCGGGRTVTMDVPSVLPLPVGHGLSTGEFPIPADQSEEHGRVVISCPAGGSDSHISVAADGCATSDPTGGMSTVGEVLMPGPGPLASDASAVVPSTDAGTLEELRDEPGNVFPVLNATLYRATMRGSEGTSLSTDFAVNSIQMNGPGAYVIRYTFDGNPGELAITEADMRAPNRYRVAVGGATFDFWFKTETRNEPFSQYMDSAYLGHALDTGQHRAWFIFGVRTHTLPSTGSATYLGRFEARAYRSDNPDHDERQHITGAMRLVANFDMNKLHGAIDAIRNTDYTRTRTDWPNSSFEITDGRIVNGQFTGTLVGKDSDPDVSFDESLKDFTGSIVGEFYGPNADEVGAVVAAERDTVGSEHGRSLYGYVVGKNVEPFAGEAIATGLHPLSGRVYGSGTKTLIVMNHGDVSSGGPSDYMYRYAREIAKRLPDATVVAVLAPGYYDRNGRVSPGSNHERRDSATPENNRYLAMTIQNLKRHLSPENVIVVGHSRGAQRLGGILGQYEGLADGAVLVAGPFAWMPRNSENPAELIDTFDTSVKVVAVTGTEDQSVLPVNSVTYVRLLKESGVDAELVLVKGEGHGYRGLNDTVVSAIGRILNGLEPGRGDPLIDDTDVGGVDAAALMTGVDRDRNADSTALSHRQSPAVESTGNGFKITYVVDGQTKTVELSGSDIGANPDRPHAYSKMTDGTEFRLDLVATDRRFQHLDISNWGIYSSSSRSFGHIIYGTRTTDMPTGGTGNFAGVMRATEWPADADVGTSNRRVTRFRGDLDLTADFGNSTVLGSVTNLESRPGNISNYQQASGQLDFNGTIDGNGISATDLSGSGDLAQYRNGSVNGAFYGPGAAEVSGVFEAEDTTNNRLLTGYFAGEQ